jgi:hypothetical protein
MEVLQVMATEIVLIFVQNENINSSSGRMKGNDKSIYFLIIK